MEGGAKAEVGVEEGVRAETDVKVEVGVKVEVSARLGISQGGGRGRGRLGRCVQSCILRCLNFPAKFVGGMRAASGAAV